MRAEIVAIGDELTSGERLDTNSQWLSQRLEEIGIPVHFHTTAGDDLESDTAVIRLAAQRAEVVILTGGLGPTADDLTRQALADAAGEPLQLDPALLEHIEQLYAARGRAMPPQNRQQALIPRGSRPIPNPHGTAPGIDLRLARSGHSDSRLFALPGVPAEMHQMWHAYVHPELVAQLTGPRRCIRHHVVKCFGVGESDLEAMLPDLIRRGQYPRVGITVHRATISLRITAEGDSPEACDVAMQPTLEVIHRSLGNLIFGYGQDELQDAVARQLIQSGRKLSTIEWETDGILAHWLGEHRDSACFYSGGVVIRDQRLAETLGIDGGDNLELSEWASRWRQRAASHYVLVVGPLLPTEGATDASDAPTVQLILAGPDQVVVRRTRYVAHPDILKERTAKQALNLLRLHLLRQDEHPSSPGA
jgi:nicotinamide-nucleotide amidase